MISQAEKIFEMNLTYDMSLQVSIYKYKAIGKRIKLRRKAMKQQCKKFKEICHQIRFQSQVLYQRDDLTRIDKACSQINFRQPKLSQSIIMEPHPHQLFFQNNKGQTINPQGRQVHQNQKFSIFPLINRHQQLQQTHLLNKSGRQNKQNPLQIVDMSCFQISQHSTPIASQNSTAKFLDSQRTPNFKQRSSNRNSSQISYVYPEKDEAMIQYPPQNRNKSQIKFVLSSFSNLPQIQKIQTQTDGKDLKDKMQNEQRFQQKLRQNIIKQDKILSKSLNNQKVVTLSDQGQFKQQKQNSGNSVNIALIVQQNPQNQLFFSNILKQPLIIKNQAQNSFQNFFKDQLSDQSSVTKNLDMKKLKKNTKFNIQRQKHLKNIKLKRQKYKLRKQEQNQQQSDKQSKS